MSGSVRVVVTGASGNVGAGVLRALTSRVLVTTERMVNMSAVPAPTFIPTWNRVAPKLAARRSGCDEV